MSPRTGQVQPAEAATNRAAALSRLHDRATAQGATEDDHFRDIIRDVRVVLELSDQNLADELLVSRPTISRWSRGVNLPHRALRKPIVTWIAAEAAQRLRALRKKPTMAARSRQAAAKAK
jgi:DNA-binding transcriptional regulator YiaG